MELVIGVAVGLVILVILVVLNQLPRDENRFSSAS